jgi:Flp pilus assembly protein TadB
MSRGFVVALVVIALLAVAAGAVVWATRRDRQAAIVHSVTMISTTTTSINPTRQAGSAEGVVAQGCRYGDAALTQVQQAQPAGPSALYVDTPDVGYLVEIEQTTETSLTSSSAINKVAADAALVRTTWDAMEPIGAPPISTLIAQIQTVISDCESMGLTTSLS